jgi:hypothetical protein
MKDVHRIAGFIRPDISIRVFTLTVQIYFYYNRTPLKNIVSPSKRTAYVRERIA